MAYMVAQGLCYFLPVFREKTEKPMKQKKLFLILEEKRKNTKNYFLVNLEK